jgi:hypothetical protein
MVNVTFCCLNNPSYPLTLLPWWHLMRSFISLCSPIPISAPPFICVSLFLPPSSSSSLILSEEPCCHSDITHVCTTLPLIWPPVLVMWFEAFTANKCTIIFSGNLLCQNQVANLHSGELLYRPCQGGCEAWLQVSVSLQNICLTTQFWCSWTPENILVCSCSICAFRFCLMPLFLIFYRIFFIS